MTVLNMSQSSSSNTFKPTLTGQIAPTPRIVLSEQVRARALRAVARDVRLLLQERKLREQNAGGQYLPRFVFTLATFSRRSLT